MPLSWLHFLVVPPTAFLLGAFYTHWATDYNVLWNRRDHLGYQTSEPSSAALELSYKHYEAYLAYAPEWVEWALMASAAVGACGLTLKASGWSRGSGGGVGVFDTAGLRS